MANRVDINQFGQPVVPGPCGPGGCPPPTQIDCIEVAKVYDLCFQAETLTRDFTITDEAVIGCICQSDDGTCTPGTAVPCQLGPATCTEISRTPVAGTDGFAAIVLQIQVPVFLFPVGTTFPPGVTVIPCDLETALITKRVTLCAPDETVTTDCTITGSCDCSIIAVNGVVPPPPPMPCWPNSARPSATRPAAESDVVVIDQIPVSLTIECALQLCITVKTVADVNLLVPAYGFCVPAECVTMGLACPTFPAPQCNVTPTD